MEMTPPRSELWAACLVCRWLWHGTFTGTDFTERSGSQDTPRWEGVRFAFGNFLQILGNNTHFHFNWWNVMEFTLGFFGVWEWHLRFFQEWPESVKPSVRQMDLPCFSSCSCCLPQPDTRVRIREFVRMGERLGSRIRPVSAIFRFSGDGSYCSFFLQQGYRFIEDSPEMRRA